MQIVVLIGVSGCGKSTIGQLLAQRLGCPFFDGDAFHPQQNIAKMSRGVPLTDEDRVPWLDRLHQLMVDHLDRRQTAVVACSALKHAYRLRLRGDRKQIRFVYLKGDFDLIWRRMQARQGHYMKAAMLHSQFETWEEPVPGEAFTVSIDAEPDAIVAAVIAELSPGA